jgi:dCMP deaminase
MCYNVVMIIGLTGKNGAGKGVVAKILQDKGFCCCSLSDVIRDEIRRRGEEVTRERLVQIGREMRARGGNGCLAQQTLARLQSDRNHVVDSFRHPDEVKTFWSSPRFCLWAVQAAPEVRFQRIKERSREQDPLTFEEFLALEAKEAGNACPEGQQLEATEQLADVRIENHGALVDLETRVLEALRGMPYRLERPSWDEYFMSLAKVAALRSNCVKRKVAAIIVKDRRVVSTGYNGTPRGTRNCFEGGCPRCNEMADSGTRLDECLCSHGEENAIVQAAYHGVSVRDATLYTTFAPCLMCTKMIINAGIREVVYNQGYTLNEASFRLLQEAGVICRQHKVD